MNTINSINITNNICFFRKREQSSAELFIKGLDKQNKKQVEGNWLMRNFGSVTGTIPLYALFAYQIALILKEKKLGKTLPINELFNVHKNNTKKFAAAFVVSILSMVGINRYLDSRTDKNYKKVKQQFNQYNKDTSAKLSDKMLYSGHVGALYNPISGTIQLNRIIVNDPITGRKNDKLIKHELVHAKQFELVARSKDGIKKINYSIINQVIQNTKGNPIIENEFEQIYHDIKNSGHRYDNIKVKVSGAEVNLKDYIEAIHILLKNPKATYNDIPIIIDEKHYQNVIDKKGELTPEEEVKADLYYKAMLDYKSINSLNAFNPFSSYRQNILEKEAYKENPSLITRISDIKKS